MIILKICGTTECVSHASLVFWKALRADTGHGADMSIEPPRRGLKIDISVFAPSSPAVQPCSLSRLGRVPPCSSSIFPATNRTHPFIASIARADFSVCVRPSIRPLHDSYPCTPPHPTPFPTPFSIFYILFNLPPQTISLATTLSRIDATKRDPSWSFSSATPDTTISFNLLHPRHPNVDSIACWYPFLHVSQFLIFDYIYICWRSKYIDHIKDQKNVFLPLCIYILIFSNFNNFTMRWWNLKVQSSV